MMPSSDIFFHSKGEVCTDFMTGTKHKLGVAHVVWQQGYEADN
jgi:hypothetical protein